MRPLIFKLLHNYARVPKSCKLNTLFFFFLFFFLLIIITCNEMLHVFQRVEGVLSGLITFLATDSPLKTIRLISKFMTSQSGKQTMHILPNISRNKANQTMKFGQLVEHSMRNIFLKKSYTKSGGETILGLFFKKSMSISLGQQSKILYSFFALYAKFGAIKIY